MNEDFKSTEFHHIHVPDKGDTLRVCEKFWINGLKKPNWFWRMMQYLFFGFRWE